MALGDNSRHRFAIHRVHLVSKCSWFSRFLVTIGQVAVAQSVAHSIVSNKKTSTVSEGKSKAHHGSQAVGGKGAAAASSGDGTSQVSVPGRGEGSIPITGARGSEGAAAIHQRMGPAREEERGVGRTTFIIKPRAIRPCTL